MKKWVFVVCLSLVLLGLPAALGACSNVQGVKINMGVSFPAGSSHNPYTIAVSQGTCSSWSLVLDQVQGGKAWCASTVPSLHVGDYVKVSFGVLFQLFRITSIDMSRHLVSVGSL